MADNAELTDAITQWQADTKRLTEISREFDPGQWGRASASDGSTNKQLLIHMATGYTVRVAVLRAVLDSKEMPEVDADAANAELLEQWENAPPAQLIEEMVRNRRQVLTLLHSLRDRHLEMPVPLRGGPRLGDALRELSAHDLEHAADLRASPPAPA